uniref:Uncharacterized protein n=1 Tax=viral metagenome TaxID=1070528 RepID=A0A6C0KTJ2_9ZZZZ
MFRLLLICLFSLTMAVNPMINIVRRVKYSSAASKLDCNVCKEALYLTWSQSPQSPQEFAKYSDHSCHAASRHHAPMEPICKMVLHTHSQKLFTGHIHRGKFDCLMTGATTCEEVSRWSVHCDRRKKKGYCQSIQIN